MNTKHTQGEWEVVDRGMWDIAVVANGGTVCHVSNKGEWFPKGDGETQSGRSHNRMLADAHVIAAASNLLEALVDLREIVAAAIRAGDWKVDGACDPDAALNRSAAAIAKARGEA